MNAKEYDNNAENMINIYTSLEVLEALSEKEYEAEVGVYRDYSIDLTNGPFTVFSISEGNSVSLKIILRDEMKTNITEVGSAVWQRGTHEVQFNGSEKLEVLVRATLHGLGVLDQYLEEEGLASLAEGMNPDLEGILITENDGVISAKIVRGKERPALECTTLFGGTQLTRPYMDEMLENEELDELSLEELTSQAESGDAAAIDKLAMKYMNGDFYSELEPDPEKAAYWMQKLAETGSSDGMFNLGLIYAKGHGVDRDFNKALEWMKKAKAAGDMDADLLIDSFEPMIENLKKAEEGDADAQATVARLYTQLSGNLDQHGPDDDFKESFYWAKKSAEQNNAEGLYILGLCYEHGRGTRKNGKRSAKYYQEAADLGHTGARFNLACYYMNGTYVEQDQERAFKMSLQSAEEGYALAMRAVGSAYQFGNGVQDDMNLAIKWYEKALEAEYDPELARKVALFKMLEENVQNGEPCFEDGELPEGYEEALMACNTADTFVYENPDIIFKGKNFVLTGCNDEALISKIITEKGGVIRSSTVLDTDYLIYGKYGEYSKKYQRALELIDRGKNIQLISEKEFFAGGHKTQSGDGCTLCIVEGDQVKCWVQNIKVIRSSIPLEDAKLIFELYNIVTGEYEKLAEGDEDYGYAGLSGLVDEIKRARTLMAQADLPESLIRKQETDDEWEDSGDKMNQIIMKYPKRYGSLKKYNIGYWGGDWEKIFGEEGEEYYWIDFTRVTKEQYDRYASELHHVYKVAELFAPGQLPFDLNDEDTVSIFGTGKFEAFADFSYGC